MAYFGVTVELLSDVFAHPNADRLDLAKVQGMAFQFVVQKASYAAGDMVIYFPIDSVLPEPVIAALGLTGKLSGKDKNRVKTVRLRGEISQGLVCRPETVGLEPATLFTGQNVAEVLGVHKYEPAYDFGQNSDLAPLPALVGVYDIEGADRFAAVVDALLDAPVSVTEKVEGSHWALNWLDGDVSVCQRRYRIKPLEGGAEHTWYKLARTSGLLDKLPDIRAALGNPSSLTFRGEAVGPGIQGNYYGLREHAVYLFDIEVDERSLDAARFAEVTQAFGLLTAPQLAYDVTLCTWLDGRTIQAASNGASLITSDKRREGIVVKPMAEGWHAAVGRLFIKQRSPDYLAESDF